VRRQIRVREAEIMTPHDAVAVFDVNETLSDMEPLSQRFEHLGADQGLAKQWFAALLRDGFALAAAGTTADFAEISRQVLGTLFAQASLDRSVDDAVDYVMVGMQSLRVHHDVPDGVRAMAASGWRLATLSNGAATVAERLLGSAGVDDVFEAFLSVADAGVWKPAAASYAYAAHALATTADRLLLVAVHPWDIHGAATAGLSTVWVNRDGVRYPSYFTAPTFEVRSLGELAATVGPPSSSGHLEPDQEEPGIS
jgi:2-haloacid dehalogenase